LKRSEEYAKQVVESPGKEGELRTSACLNSQQNAFKRAKSVRQQMSERQKKIASRDVFPRGDLFGTARKETFQTDLRAHFSRSIPPLRKSVSSVKNARP
jgi:hypothetical protein